MSQPSNVNEYLDYLEFKIKKLVSVNEGLRDEITRLNGDKLKQKEIIDRQKDSLKNFQNQFKINTLVNSIAGDAVNADAFIAKVDLYLAEIDKCIEYLSE